MSYNSANIRRFLRQYFSDEELKVFCFDYFTHVYHEFALGMTKSQEIQLLLTHCLRQGKTFDLMAALQRERPSQFNQYFDTVQVSTNYPLHSIQRDPHQIFISYAHQDSEFAHQLAHDLTTNGYPIWIAPDSIQPGEKWVESINRGLAESGIFLLLLTNAAINSRWVQSETNAAITLEHQGEIQFIPLQAEQCIPPPLWQTYQWVTFLDDYQTGLRQLLVRLKSSSTQMPTIQQAHQETNMLSIPMLESLPTNQTPGPTLTQANKKSLRAKLFQMLILLIGIIIVGTFSSQIWNNWKSNSVADNATSTLSSTETHQSAVKPTATTTTNERFFTISPTITLNTQPTSTPTLPPANTPTPTPTHTNTSTSTPTQTATASPTITPQLLPYIVEPSQTPTLPSPVIESYINISVNPPRDTDCYGRNITSEREFEIDTRLVICVGGNTSTFPGEPPFLTGFSLQRPGGEDTFITLGANCGGSWEDGSTRCGGDYVEVFDKAGIYVITYAARDKNGIWYTGISSQFEIVYQNSDE